MSAGEMFTRNRPVRRCPMCRVLVSVLLFTFVNLTQIGKGNAAIAPVEEKALEVLRESFQQNPWTGDPCGNPKVDWIVCFRPNGSQFDSVETITLPNKNVNGTLPTAITNLTHLDTLQLTFNDLSGTIPSLTKMANLSTLDLSSNSFSGSIPNHTAVVYLYLNDNNLSGGIPPSAFQHQTLKELRLQNNPLGGPIPDASQLINIKTLNLSNCALNGTLPSLSSMKELVDMSIADNAALGGIVPDTSDLVSLQSFAAQNCRFSGPVPTFQGTKGMQKLYIYNNNMNGTIPPELFLQENLRWFRLDQNPNLSGELPDMSKLLQLQELYVNDCNLTGPLPDSFANGQFLNIVDMHDNFFTSVPPDLTNLSRLFKLDLHNNSISSSLPLLPPGTAQPDEGFRLQWVIFDQNHFTGEIPDSWSELSFLNGMILANNNLTGEIPKSLGNLSSLLYMNLSSNMLSGSIPEELSGLTNLKVLDLRNNRFNGTVPASLAKLQSLEQLRLDNNNFTGIPDVIFRMNLKNLTLANNTNLKIISTAVETSKSKLSTGAIVGIAVGAAAVVIVVLVILFLLLCRKKTTFQFNEEEKLSIADMPKSAQYFTLKQIKVITDNNKRLVGKGGFGQVYYGKLPDGKEVAVKVRTANSKQGTGEFLNEVRLLSRLHHRNLVPLIGYCLEEHQQILVYAFMSQGTLHDHLYHTGISHTTISESAMVDPASPIVTWKPLSWRQRLDIAMNAARGLEYLHKDCNPPIIHRDVKTSNILLTEKLLAKVADLGISKQANEQDAEEMNMSGISTAIKGTLGYLDPEYFARHKLTTKSDVYSFGIVLFEIITGRRPQAQKYPGSNERNLIDWVRVAEENDDVESVVDLGLHGEYSKEGLLKVTKLALSCAVNTGVERPEMGEVIRVLIEAMQLEGEYVDTPMKDESFVADTPKTVSVPESPGSSNNVSSMDSLTHPSWNTKPR